MQTHPKTTLDGGPRLSEDEIFTLLSARRRRDFIRELDRAGGEATFGRLTDAIATGESDDHSNRKAVYVSLYQTHVPRLVEAGVVERDERSQSLRLTARATDLLAYLEFDPVRKRGGLLSRFFRSTDREHAE